MAMEAAAQLAAQSEGVAPVGPIDITAGLTVALVACLVVSAVLIAAAVLLSRPRRGTTHPHAVHVPNADRARWQRRIDDVLLRHKSGVLGSEEAFVALAAICRDFASAHIGRDMSAHTLADISMEPRNPVTRSGLDLLRVTIEALYPPEFADPAWASNRPSVEDAAGWVSKLVERWGR